MTHQQQLDELKQALQNRLAQSTRISQSIIEIENRLRILGEVVENDVKMVPLSIQLVKKERESVKGFIGGLLSAGLFEIIFHLIK